MVGPGDRDGIEVRAEQPCRGRGLLDLRDQVHAARRLGGEGGVQIPRSRHVGDGGAELLDRPYRFGGRDLGPLGFDDAVQYSAHTRVGIVSPPIRGTQRSVDG